MHYSRHHITALVA